MSHRKLLLDALDNYSTDYESEKKFANEIIEFVKNNEDCFERSNLSGHITGSSLLLNSNKDKTLLTHHKKLNRWLQLGGHSDGDNNTWDVALKEAEEESGIENIKFITRDIFDIDVHVIPERKGVPEHKHYDIRFLLQAPTEDFVISDESNNLEWISIEQLNEMEKSGELDESITRMLNKWNKM